MKTSRILVITRTLARISTFTQTRKKRLGTKALATILIMELAGCGGSGGSDGGSTRSAAPIDPATLEFTTYSPNDGTFKISHPKLWITSAAPDDDPAILFETSTSYDGISLSAVMLLLKSTENIKQSDPDLARATVVSSRQLTIAGLDATEEVLDANIRNEDGSVDSVRVMLTSFTEGGFNYGIAYIAARNDFDLYLDVARYMAASLEVGDVLFSDMHWASDERPAVATDGDNFLVVACWDKSNMPGRGPASLIAKVITAERTISQQLTIADSMWDRSCKFAPSIAFNGSEYLVVYAADGDIYAKRIGLNGAVIDTNPILVSKEVDPYSNHPGAEPEVIYDGTRFFVVWYSVSDSRKILGATISRDGVVSDPFVLQDLELPVNCGYEPHLALGNANILLMWSLQCGYNSDESNSPRALYTKLLDLNGTPLSAEPLEVRAAEPDFVLFPQVASDGNSYLVSWIGGHFPPATVGTLIDPGIYAVRITPEGLPLDNPNGGVAIIPPDSAITSRFFLTLNFHEGRYFFTWTDITYTDSAGIYGFSTSPDISAVSTPRTIPARGDYNHRQAAVSFSNHQSLLVSAIGSAMNAWYFNSQDYE